MTNPPVAPLPRPPVKLALAGGAAPVEPTPKDAESEPNAPDATAPEAIAPLAIDPEAAVIADCVAKVPALVTACDATVTVPVNATCPVESLASVTRCTPVPLTPLPIVVVTPLIWLTFTD